MKKNQPELNPISKDLLNPVHSEASDPHVIVWKEVQSEPTREKSTDTSRSSHHHHQHHKVKFPLDQDDSLLTQQKESKSTAPTPFSSPPLERKEPKKLDLNSDDGETSLSERIEEHVLLQQQNPTTACFHPPDKESDQHPSPRKFIQAREQLLKKHANSKELLTLECKDDEDCDEDLTKRKSQLLSVNQFEMLNLLGVGSAGHVYLVRKKDNNHLYAMKVILFLLFLIFFVLSC